MEKNKKGAISQHLSLIIHVNKKKQNCKNNRTNLEAIYKNKKDVFH